MINQLAKSIVAQFIRQTATVSRTLMTQTAGMWLTAAGLMLADGTATAQESAYHHPLHHRLPPGQAAAWMNTIRNYDPAWLQPIRIELPSEGTVSVFSASPQPALSLTTPAQFSVNPGHWYRLRIADMPEFPGLEVYPSVEILDHLHPPVGREQDYPIPVVLTADDIRQALQGQMVTRVIYLEQPQLAAGYDPLRREVPHSVANRDNALEEADRLGRPMLIIRVGGRIPSGPDMHPAFFGSGGFVDAPASGGSSVPTAQRFAAPGSSRVAAR